MLTNIAPPHIRRKEAPVNTITSCLTYIAGVFVMLFMFDNFMKRFCKSDTIKHNLDSVQIEDQGTIPKVEQGKTAGYFINM